MGGVLVKAARHHAAIPRDDGALPHAPALVEHGIAQGPEAVGAAVVPPEFGVPGEQRVAVFRLVDLGGFHDEFVDPEFCRHPLQILQLVFIGAHHEELPDHMGGATPQPPLGVQYGPCTGEDLVELSADPVARIGVLGGPIDGDDQPVDAAVDDSFRPCRAEVVRVGGRAHIEPILLANGHEVVHARMQVRFPLKVEVEVDQVPGQAIGTIEQLGQAVGVQHAGGAGEASQPARAFRTTQVARRGGLHTEAHGPSGHVGQRPAAVPMVDGLAKGPLQPPGIGTPGAVEHFQSPNPVSKDRAPTGPRAARWAGRNGHGSRGIHRVQFTLETSPNRPACAPAPLKFET